MKIEFKSIGIIRTPYESMAPFRPDDTAEGEFSIVVDEEYAQAMMNLEHFSHIIVFFHFDRALKTNLIAHPPHMGGRETGLFASRSPNRINKIGMDVVKIRAISNNIIHTSPMDILNQTALLDIKPYIPDLDSHPEAKNTSQM